MRESRRVILFMIIGVIHNTIMQALADRVIRAYKDKKSFQVIIVIPLKPEFRKDSPELKTVAYLTHSTISGAEDSFFKQLMSGGSKPVCNTYVILLFFCSKE